MSVKIKVIFEPAFIAEVTDIARQSQAEQRKADGHKWDLAERVNSEWPEYEHMIIENERVFKTKLDYFAAMSQAINTQLNIGAFAESGQTLRFYCELQATLGNIPGIEELLKASSIDHLRRAKRLAADNKIITDGGQLAGADYAIAKAIEKKFSAEDMENYFDPKQEPHPYDKLKETLEWMTTKDAWQFIKNTERRDECIFYTNVIRKIVATELEKEGKAL